MSSVTSQTVYTSLWTSSLLCMSPLTSQPVYTSIWTSSALYVNTDVTPGENVIKWHLRLSGVAGNGLPQCLQTWVWMYLYYWTILLNWNKPSTLAGAVLIHLFIYLTCVYTILMNISLVRWWPCGKAGSAQGSQQELNLNSESTLWWTFKEVGFKILYQP